MGIDQDKNQDANRVVVATEGERLADQLSKAGAKPGERVDIMTHGPEHQAGAMRHALAESERYMPAADEAERRFREANHLMAEGAFSEAISALQALAQEAPTRRGDCENNIGACLFFMGRYAEAIKHYRLAGKHGFDPAMVEDNIKEAEEALAKQTGG